MEKHFSADIGFLRVLDERNGFLQKVELRLLNSKVNRNNWQFMNLEEHRKLFAETPILVAYVGNKIGDGHNFKKVETEDGEIASFMGSTAERIVGWFKSEEDIRIEEIDGTKWIVGIGYIWVWYAQELVAKIKKQGLDGMSVSIETIVYEGQTEGNGVEVYTKYGILGTTILGDDVNPAVKGANIRALSALGEKGVHELTLRVASEQKQGNNPQKQNKKGERTMKIFTIEDLRDKFPGYTVLSVNESNVALLSDKGRMAKYSFKGEEETVIPENIQNVAAVCVLSYEGDKQMEVSIDTIVGTMRERLNAAQSALTEETERANKLQTKLNEMEAKEKERRMEVVKNAIKDQMKKNNKGRECEIDEAICKDLEDKAEEYACMVNANGEWIGESEIRKEVDSRCMAEIRKISEKKIRENSQRIYAWEPYGDKGEVDSEAEQYNAIIAKYDK